MKLNGYRASHRNKWLFVRHKILTLQELSLLEFYADTLVFDKDKDNFGLFEVNFRKITEIFQCKSENTVRNWHNKLLKLGFIKITKEKHYYKLACFLRYISTGFWQGKAGEYAELEKNQPIEKILQNFGINLQPIEEKPQPVVKKSIKLASEKSTIALVSSKDNSSYSVRTDQYYEKIYREGGYKLLIPEDMKWIDENLMSD